MPYQPLAFRRPLLPDGSDGLRLRVRAFLADQPFEPRCDSWLAGFDPVFSQRLAERGWVAMTWPERYGGHARSPLDRHVVIEELLAAGAPVAAHWISDRQSGPLRLRYELVAQAVLAAPGFTLRGGTSEILRGIVARGLVGR